MFFLTATVPTASCGKEVPELMKRPTVNPPPMSTFSTKVPWRRASEAFQYLLLLVYPLILSFASSQATTTTAAAASTTIFSPSTVNNGLGITHQYTAQYAAVCDVATINSYATAVTACAGLGSGWALATIPSAAAQTAISALSTNVMWLAGSDAAVEGDWRWTHGRLTNSRFYRGQHNVGGTCTIPPCSCESGAFCNWRISPAEPSDDSANEDYVGLAPSGWNDVPVSASTVCAACERSLCTLALDCNATNTLSVNTSKYFVFGEPCGCVCKGGFTGPRCDDPIVPVNTGAYTAEYAVRCASQGVTYPTARDACAAAGPGWALASVPSRLAFERLTNLTAYRTWLGGSDDGHPATWQWRFGRLTNRTFYRGNFAANVCNAPPCACEPGMFCHWHEPKQPNDFDGNQHYLEMFGTEKALGDPNISYLWNDLEAWSAAPQCYACERSPCSLALDCNATNTMSVNTSKYYVFGEPCGCVCKDGFTGPRCDSPIDPVNTTFSTSSTTNTTEPPTTTTDATSGSAPSTTASTTTTATTSAAAPPSSSASSTTAEPSTTSAATTAATTTDQTTTVTGGPSSSTTTASAAPPAAVSTTAEAATATDGTTPSPFVTSSSSPVTSTAAEPSTTTAMDSTNSATNTSGPVADTTAAVISTTTAAASSTTPHFTTTSAPPSPQPPTTTSTPSTPTVTGQAPCPMTGGNGGLTIGTMLSRLPPSVDTSSGGSAASVVEQRAAVVFTFPVPGILQPTTANAAAVIVFDPVWEPALSAGVTVADCSIILNGTAIRCTATIRRDATTTADVAAASASPVSAKWVVPPQYLSTACAAVLPSNAPTLALTILPAADVTSHDGGAATIVVRVGAALFAATSLPAVFGDPTAVEFQLGLMMLLSGCVPEPLRDAARYAQYLLSPLINLGPTAVIAGHVSAAALTLLIHGIITYTHQSPDDHSTTPPPRWSRFINGWPAARFPSVSFAVAAVLYPGVAHACAATIGEIASGGNGGSAVAAVVLVLGLLFLIAVPVGGAVLILRIGSASVFIDAAQGHTSKGLVSWLLVPEGQWGPASVERVVGTIRGFGNPRGRLLLLPHSCLCIAVAYLSATTTAPSSFHYKFISSSSPSCAPRLYAAGSLLLGAAVTMGLLRPFRHRLTTCLSAASLASTGVVGLLAAAAAAASANQNPLNGNVSHNSSSSSSLQRASIAFLFIVAALTLLRTLHWIVLGVMAAASSNKKRSLAHDDDNRWGPHDASGDSALLATPINDETHRGGPADNNTIPLTGIRKQTRQVNAATSDNVV